MLGNYCRCIDQSKIFTGVLGDMQHFWSLDGIFLENAWLTIGSFDGVHRGHQAILNQLVAGASKQGVPAVVLTFHPHPAVVLRNRQGPYYLTLPEERAILMGNLGIDMVITHPFSKQVAEYSADEFVERLVKHLRIGHLVVGHDFALGCNRQGDVNYLKGLGENHGFSVELFQPVTDNREIISSSAIRAALREGDLKKVNSMLGRTYHLSGLVEHGDGRGRSIGIPTANVAVAPDLLTPSAGVYVSEVKLGDRVYAAVTNIGYRPTFYDQANRVHVEAHILDFEDDLYQQEISVSFLERLRGEQRFSNAEALVNQIQKDIQVTRDSFRKT